MTTTSPTSKPFPLPGTSSDFYRPGLIVWAEPTSELPDNHQHRNGGLIINKRGDSLTCAQKAGGDVRDRELGVRINELTIQQIHTCQTNNCPACPALNTTNEHVKLARTIARAIANRHGHKARGARLIDNTTRQWINHATTINQAGQL
jgi:hypothetical protein